MLIGFALVLARCGGGVGTGGSGDGSSGIGGASRPTCSATLSGAVTGTFDCTPAFTVFSPERNVTALHLEYLNLAPPVGSVGHLLFTFEINGRPQTTTYTPANVRLGGGQVSVNGAQGLTFYDAFTSQGPGSSLRMAITGLDPWPTSPQTNSYMHGTADATIPYGSGPGARGNVILHATFQ